jgi:hypothetical protein
MFQVMRSGDITVKLESGKAAKIKSVQAGEVFPGPWWGVSGTTVRVLIPRRWWQFWHDKRGIWKELPEPPSNGANHG